MPFTATGRGGIVEGEPVELGGALLPLLLPWQSHVYADSRNTVQLHYHDVGEPGLKAVRRGQLNTLTRELRVEVARVQIRAHLATNRYIIKLQLFM